MFSRPLARKSLSDNKEYFKRLEQASERAREIQSRQTSPLKQVRHFFPPLALQKPRAAAAAAKICDRVGSETKTNSDHAKWHNYGIRLMRRRFLVPFTTTRLTPARNEWCAVVIKVSAGFVSFDFELIRFSAQVICQARKRTNLKSESSCSQLLRVGLANESTRLGSARDSRLRRQRLTAERTSKSEQTNLSE